MMSRRSRLAIVLALLVPALAAAQEFTEFNLGVGTLPWNVTYGPDGNIWWTEYNAGKIGTLVPSTGAVTEFPLPSSSSNPIGIASGPDGNVWFTEESGNAIGRITPAGTITEFSIPHSGSYPIGIVTGPDGNLWFAEYSGLSIGRITAAGVITEFSLPVTGAGPEYLAVGPDGNIWFTEQNANKIGVMTTSGSLLAEYPVPSGASGPAQLAAGPDGNVWFTEYNTGKIGRVSTAGVIAEFVLPNTPAQPMGITGGADGNVWFADNSGFIGSITPAGAVTEYGIPTLGGEPNGIASDASGNLWFTEVTGAKIARFTLPPACAAPGPPVLNVNGAASASINAGDTYTLAWTDTLAAAGEPGQYEVKVSADGGTTYTHVTTVAATTYQHTTIANDAGRTFLFTVTAEPDCGPSADAAVSTPVTLTVNAPTTGCTPSDTTLCLNSARFQVQVTWTDFQGNTGTGHVVPGVSSDDSGIMWFFGPSNWELLIKVLNGCVVNGHYWVLGAASTNVQYVITVTDTQSGAVRQYSNPLGTASPAITDASAFLACP